jgi:hypothetical protein
MNEQSKIELETQMKANDMRNRSIQTCATTDYQAPITSVALVIRLRRYVNPRTLAFVMFVAFALLHTMHGRDAETVQPATRIENSEASRETSEREEAVRKSLRPQKVTEKIWE